MAASIPDFFAAKNVLITGGTGFIGKVLIEKLLRCCNKVEKIYCVVRSKGSSNVKEREKKFINSKIFDRVREQEGNDVLSKIVFLDGDIQQTQLGLNAEDIEQLISCIDIVFHCAATVKFDEPLMLAVQQNVGGTLELINLTKKFSRLQCLVHLSTAYANCDMKQIEERLYPVPYDPHKILEMITWMPEETLAKITVPLIGSKPNTYTFTKHLAECLVVSESPVPTAIVRPSIVGASWKEPFPGWIDNLNGPSGVYVGNGKGILRGMLVDRQWRADIVPVDIPVNLMIACAWHMAKVPLERRIFYNCTVDPANACKWGEMPSIVSGYFEQVPLENAYRPPKTVLTESETQYHLRSFFGHKVPAFIIDAVWRLLGWRPRMTHLYTRVEKMVWTLQFFSKNHWEWTRQNVFLLGREMSSDDLETFYITYDSSLSWKTYLENFCFGAKKYLLGEDCSEKRIAELKLRLKRVKMAYASFKLLLAYLCWRYVLPLASPGRQLQSTVTSLISFLLKQSESK